MFTTMNPEEVYETANYDEVYETATATANYDDATDDYDNYDDFEETFEEEYEEIDYDELCEKVKHPEEYEEEIVFNKFPVMPIALPRPFQLAALSSSFITLDEMTAYYKSLEENSKFSYEVDTIIGFRSQKNIEEKEKKNQQKEEEEEEEKKKKKEAEEKKQKKEEKDVEHIPFATQHKKQIHFRITSEDVIKARRALHRREKKEANAKAFLARQLEFSAATEKVAPPPSIIVSVPTPEESEEALDQQLFIARQKILLDEQEVKEKEEEEKNKKIQEKEEEEEKKKKIIQLRELEKKKEEEEQLMILCLNRSKFYNTKKTMNNVPAPIPVKHIPVASSHPEPRNLNKTRLCNSVTDGVPCRHGAKCRFAHSTNELVTPACRFGESCKLVKMISFGKYENAGSKQCLWTHPHESQANFVSRTTSVPAPIVLSIPSSSPSPPPSSSISFPPLPTSSSPSSPSPSSSSPPSNPWNKIPKCVVPMHIVLEEEKNSVSSIIYPSVPEKKEKKEEKVNVFSAPDPFSQGKQKTKLCISVSTNTPCPHGSKCRFAHNQNELVVGQCLYGASCHFIREVAAGQYVNTGFKKCAWLHPGETKTNYNDRLSGKVAPRVVPTPPPQVPVAPQVVPTPPPQVPVAPRVVPTPPPQVPVAHRVVPTPQDSDDEDTGEEIIESNIHLISVPSSTPSVTLHVPRELAIASMKKALELGKTQIRIVIV